MSTAMSCCLSFDENMNYSVMILIVSFPLLSRLSMEKCLFDVINNKS